MALPFCPNMDRAIFEQARPTIEHPICKQTKDRWALDITDKSKEICVGAWSNNGNEAPLNLHQIVVVIGEKTAKHSQ